MKHVFVRGTWRPAGPDNEDRRVMWDWRYATRLQVANFSGVFYTHQSATTWAYAHTYDIGAKFYKKHRRRLNLSAYQGHAEWNAHWAAKKGLLGKRKGSP